MLAKLSENSNVLQMDTNHSQNLVGFTNNFCQSRTSNQPVMMVASQPSLNNTSPPSYLERHSYSQSSMPELSDSVRSSLSKVYESPKQSCQPPIESNSKYQCVANNVNNSYEVYGGSWQNHANLSSKGVYYNQYQHHPVYNPTYQYQNYQYQNSNQFQNLYPTYYRSPHDSMNSGQIQSPYPHQPQYQYQAPINQQVQFCYSSNLNRGTLRPTLSDFKGNAMSTSAASVHVSHLPKQIKVANNHVDKKRKLYSVFGTLVWTRKDDELLKSLRVEERLGWKEVASRFPGRTVNACQCRLKRLLKHDKKNQVVVPAASSVSEIHKISMKF